MIDKTTYEQLNTNEIIKVASQTKEAFCLFSSSENNLELAIYLSEQILNKLVDGCNSAVAVAIEEVSHAVYTIYKAFNGVQVSALEIETQAEIDKYSVLAFRLLNNGDYQKLNNLPEYLFKKLSLLPGLSKEERRRYKKANKQAMEFINTHIHNNVLERRYKLAIKTLRKIYRCSGMNKLNF